MLIKQLHSQVSVCNKKREFLYELEEQLMIVEEEHCSRIWDTVTGERRYRSELEIVSSLVSSLKHQWQTQLRRVYWFNKHSYLCKHKGFLVKWYRPVQIYLSGGYLDVVRSTSKSGWGWHTAPGQGVTTAAVRGRGQSVGGMSTTSTDTHGASGRPSASVLEWATSDSICGAGDQGTCDEHLELVYRIPLHGIELIEIDATVAKHVRHVFNAKQPPYRRISIILRKGVSIVPFTDDGKHAVGKEEDEDGLDGDEEWMSGGDGMEENGEELDVQQPLEEGDEGGEGEEPAHLPTKTWTEQLRRRFGKVVHLSLPESPETVNHWHTVGLIALLKHLTAHAIRIELRGGTAAVPIGKGDRVAARQTMACSSPMSQSPIPCSSFPLAASVPTSTPAPSTPMIHNASSAAAILDHGSAVPAAALDCQLSLSIANSTSSAMNDSILTSILSEIGYSSGLTSLESLISSLSSSGGAGQQALVGQVLGSGRGSRTQRSSLGSVGNAYRTIPIPAHIGSLSVTRLSQSSGGSVLSRSLEDHDTTSDESSSGKHTTTSTIGTNNKSQQLLLAANATKVSSSTAKPGSGSSLSAAIEAAKLTSPEKTTAYVPYTPTSALVCTTPYSPPVETGRRQPTAEAEATPATPMETIRDMLTITSPDANAVKEEKESEAEPLEVNRALFHAVEPSIATTAAGETLPPPALSTHTTEESADVSDPKETPVISKSPVRIGKETSRYPSSTTGYMVPENRYFDQLHERMQEVERETKGTTGLTAVVLQQRLTSLRWDRDCIKNMLVEAIEMREHMLEQLHFLESLRHMVHAPPTTPTRNLWKVPRTTIYEV